MKKIQSRDLGLDAFGLPKKCVGVIVFDELGYISFDKVEPEILFNLLSNRNDKGSIIINSNLTFDCWNEVFNDTMLTGALVERLVH